MMDNAEEAKAVFFIDNARKKCASAHLKIIGFFELLKPVHEKAFRGVEV
jgi:hypothetical protein